jgi:D-inositol-3-phosphate glycosyltransferase
VLSSDTEGMPGAVLEAMSMGLPVVATAVGGTPEILEDGLTGRLVPPRDPIALAAAITAVLDAPDRRAMGARGRATVVERYSPNRVVQETDTLYRRLMNTDTLCAASPAR